MEVLDENGIARVGAGSDPSKAAAPFLFEAFGKRIGVYACAEHEFSIVSDSRPGANPFNALETPDQISSLKSECDYIIVLYHGGKELYQYPSPQLQKRCRKLVEKGTDLVICQHSHCIGCEEKYLNGTIVYGQGNFLFDKSENELWKTGLLVRLDGSFHVSYIPIVKADHGVRAAEGDEKDGILNSFAARSREILVDGFVEKSYNELTERSFNHYLLTLSGKESFLFRALNRLFGGALRRRQMKRRYDIKQRIKILNYLECEAHNEILLRGLKNEWNRD